jgi:hypothetical protein
MAVTEHEADIGQVVLEIGEITEGPLLPSSRPKKQKPVTVCEAIANRKKFSGKPIAIVGRIECGSSLIDHVCFLAEERCQQRFDTDGFTSPNKVLIVNYWEEGMPKPPAITPETDGSALLRKLSKVRKTTSLGQHKVQQFKTEGAQTFSYLADVEVNDEWGIAYGLFFTAKALRNDGCTEVTGCAVFNGAPVALITTPNALHALHTEEQTNFIAVPANAKATR